MRSVAKGNYIKGVGGITHALAHVRYLQMRGGDDRDHALGGKRLFINANREAISGSEVNERIKQMDESKVVIHRIVLSPGLAGVDMVAYTRAVMTALERSKGLDIEYYATGHKNTDHEHNHVVLLGRDQHGRQVTLNRSNYKTIREAGDRYLERHHKYDRYLDKELETIMRDGYKHDRGDRHFEWLLEDLKSNLTPEECDEKRRNPPSGFIKEFAIYALPESERIVRDNVVYTKYSSLQDLLDLDEKLTKSQVSRVPKDQYQKLWSWIGNKKQFGDDYYEKTAETDRLFQQFEEDLKRSISTDNSPPKSFRQYIFESRGRLLDSHEKYTIDTQRLQLEKHLQSLDESGNADPEHRQGLIEQIDWLNAMSAERIESRKPIPKIPRSKENKNSMHGNFAKDRNLSNSEERERWGSELVERAWKKLLGDQPEDYDKFSPQGKKATQEALGREIAKITAEDHQQQKQEKDYWTVESSPIKNKSQETEQKDRDLDEPLHSSDRQLDVDKVQSSSNITELIFGDEPSITLSDHNKMQIEHQIDLWQKIAFDADPNRNLPEQGNLAERNSDRIEKTQDNNIEQSQEIRPSVDQIMSHQVQDNMHQQIQQTFTENRSSNVRAEVTPLNKENHEPGQERDDDGREHNR